MRASKTYLSISLKIFILTTKLFILYAASITNFEKTQRSLSSAKTWTNSDSYSFHQVELTNTNQKLKLHFRVHN
jgi:hypothetical protein